MIVCGDLRITSTCTNITYTKKILNIHIRALQQSIFELYKLKSKLLHAVHITNRNVINSHTNNP